MPERRVTALSPPAYKPEYRAVIDGVTHAAYENPAGAHATACGLPCMWSPLFREGVMVPRAPDIDCMACIAHVPAP